MTFMVHPEHGATNVSASEVADMEKNGWAVSTHEKWMADNGKGEKPVEAPIVLPVLDEPPRRKLGRPFKVNKE